MSKADWIGIILISPLVLYIIPNVIVFVKEFFEAIIDEWRDLPRRLK